MTDAESAALQAYETCYWEMVEATLAAVFDLPPDAASVKVARLRQTNASRPEAERALAFHAGPLSLAARMLGAPITDRQARRYFDLAAERAWDQGGPPPAPDTARVLSP